MAEVVGSSWIQGAISRHSVKGQGTVRDPLRPFPPLTRCHSITA